MDFSLNNYRVSPRRTWHVGSRDRRFYNFIDAYYETPRAPHTFRRRNTIIIELAI